MLSMHQELANKPLSTISMVLGYGVHYPLGAFVFGVDKGVETEEDIVSMREERISAVETLVMVVVRESSSVLDSDNLCI